MGISGTPEATGLRDALLGALPLGAGAWTSYTPTLTQSATVTKTVNYGKYFRVGRLVVAQAFLSVTGAGTAAQTVLAGLPVPAAFFTAPLEVGAGDIFDSSAGLAYKGVAIMQAASVIQFRASALSSGVLGSTDFTAALASGDTVSFSVSYEAAT